MIKPEMVVRFKDDYNGYFKELKGKNLTVNQVFKGDKHDPATRVTLVNIDEMHLINADWLKEVSNAKIN